MTPLQPSAPAQPVDRVANLELLGGGLLDLRERFDRLAEVSSGRTRRALTAGLSLARSDGPLGLTAAGSASVLRSTEEVNTTPTSFSPREPEASGGSTSALLLEGIYDGDQGDDSLSFNVTLGGIVGTTLATVEVEDSGGNVIDTLNLGFAYTPGDAITLSNGLEASFSAGNLNGGDTFGVDVSTSVGTALAADKAFDGQGNDDPLLEAGFAVTDGSFLLNGTQVDVFAGDSANDLFARIESSVADVSVSYDAETDSVTFERLTSGDLALELSNDTSGVLAALKLDGAVATPGATGVGATLLQDEPAFAGISAGSFFVGGVEISVDPGADTLIDVLDRIAAAVPGVSAEYDASSDRVEIQASDGELILSADSSGFLAGVLIDEGTYGQEQQSSGRLRARVDQPDRLSAEFGRFLGELEDFLQLDVEGIAVGNQSSTRSLLRQALLGSFEQAGYSVSGDRVTSDFGLRLDFSSDARKVARLDRGRLLQVGRQDAGDLLAVLNGNGEAGSRGLIERLERALDQAADGLVANLGDASALAIRLDVRG